MSAYYNAKTTATDSEYSQVQLPKEGDYIYARRGISVAFYTDATGATQVGPSGGKGGQSSSPTKNNGEVVGLFTGKREVLNGVAMLQVNWTNTWWQNGFPKGQHKSENKTSWVKEKEVTWSSDYIAPSTDNTAPVDYDGSGESSGIGTSGLLLIGVGAALLLKKKKKGKR